MHSLPSLEAALLKLLSTKLTYAKQGDIASSEGALHLQVLWSKTCEPRGGYVESWDGLDQVGAAEPGCAVQVLLNKLETGGR